MTLSLKENKRQKGKKNDIIYMKEKKRKRNDILITVLFFSFYIKSWEDIPKRKENLIKITLENVFPQNFPIYSGKEKKNKNFVTKHRVEFFV